MSSSSRPELHLVPNVGALERVAQWSWFCGHCAAPPPAGVVPAPSARVCPSCGLGLLLEAPREVVPSSREAFVVVDSGLTIQAVSYRAEKLLGVREDTVIDRQLAELLIGAETDGDASAPLASVIVDAVDGEDSPRRVQLRPANMFGVRWRARVAPCGPPRAALLALDGPQLVSRALL